MLNLFKKKEFVYTKPNLILFGKDTGESMGKMTTFDLVLFSLIEELGESYYRKLLSRQPTLFPKKMLDFLDNHFKELNELREEWEVKQ